MKKGLLEFTGTGIYCKQADIYIDPWRPVKTAIITHAHSDHAYAGHKTYISSKDSLPLLKHRLGHHIDVQAKNYSESFEINGVKFSLHPAGHIIGSAQVRVEYQGEVWVAAGDYKRENDGISGGFEVVPCDTFITESTFGIPAFRWTPQQIIYEEINHWWSENASKGRTSVIGAYSLGKAQRILAGINPALGPIYCHGAVANTNDVLDHSTVKLPDTKKISDTDKKSDYENALVICPPASLNSSWTKRFKDHVTGQASGWMAIRGHRRRRSVDKGFVLSDHADWDDLLKTVRETGASNVLVTHGYTTIFANYLKELGYNALAVSTHYSGDESVE